jgi:prepilin-type N-terminal cleavage/methylation domain-containing protein
MFRRVNKGLTIIEVIIVLAISAGLAVISIGAFSSRGRTQADEAAKLVMADIAKVRNEAVQGLGPTTTAGASKLTGNQIFGQAIEFRTGSDNALGDTMRVYKLMISGTTISAYEYYDIPLTSGLKLFVTQSGTVSTEPCSTSFLSCYYNYQLGVADYQTLLELAVGNRMIVIRNRTGETYTFNRAKTQPSGFDSTFGMSNGVEAGGGSSLGNYQDDKQGRLRIAMGIPGNGANANAQMQAARFQYYAIFDMQIPNNQEFKVVK